MTTTFMYRFELLGQNKFLPDNLDDNRHTLTLGWEFGLQEPDPLKKYWIPKFCFSIGPVFNIAGEESDDFLLINFGIKFTSPTR